MYTSAAAPEVTGAIPHIASAGCHERARFCHSRRCQSFGGGDARPSHHRRAGGAAQEYYVAGHRAGHPASDTSARFFRSLGSYAQPPQRAIYIGDAQLIDRSIHGSRRSVQYRLLDRGDDDLVFSMDLAFHARDCAAAQYTLEALPGLAEFSTSPSACARRVSPPSSGWKSAIIRRFRVIRQATLYPHC